MYVGHLNSIVKEQSQCEVEVNKAVAKIKETIQREAAKAAESRLSIGNIGQSNAANNFQKNHVDNDSIDEESRKGHFGWAKFGETYIPYVLRRTQNILVKYCALRMVEMELPTNYLNFLRSNVSDCTYVRSYHITAAESRLLNEINFKHLDCKYSAAMFVLTDKVITLADANECYQFLHICFWKHMVGRNALVPNKCGFVLINNDSAVSYIVRGEDKLVPWFYFKGGKIESMRLQYVSGWDFSYFKVCFKVQGITEEYYPGDSMAVVNFKDIRKYFSRFEDYWPNVGRPLLISTSRNKNTSLQHWTEPQTLPNVQLPPFFSTQVRTITQKKVQPQQALPNVRPTPFGPTPVRDVAPRTHHRIPIYPYLSTSERQVQQLLVPTCQNYNTSAHSTATQAQQDPPQLVITAPVFNNVIPEEVSLLPREPPNPIFNVIQRPQSNVPKRLSSTVPKPVHNIHPANNVVPKNNREVRKYVPYVTDSVPREMQQNVQQNALTKGWLNLSQTGIQQNIYPLQPEDVLRISQSHKVARLSK